VVLKYYNETLAAQAGVAGSLSLRERDRVREDPL